MSQRSAFSGAVGNHAEALSNKAFDVNRGRIHDMSLKMGGQNLVTGMALKADSVARPVTL